MSDVSKTNGVIARLTVQRGALTEYPLAEKVRGGWQNGVTFYPDGEVTKVQELTVAIATRAPVPGELNDVRDEFPETVAFIRENAAALGLPVQGEPNDERRGDAHGWIFICWLRGPQSGRRASIRRAACLVLRIR